MTTKPGLAPVPDVGVDIGALACTIRIDAAKLIANLIVQTTDALDPDAQFGRTDLALSGPQRVELISIALQEFQGFELRVAKELKQALESGGVATWGLPEELERALGA